MVVISHALFSYFLAMNLKVRFIHPRNVRSYFNISRNDYTKNKQASIDFLSKLLSTSQLEQANLRRFKKKDDCADAIILAFYAVKNYGAFETIQDAKTAKSHASSEATPSSFTSGREARVKRKRVRQRAKV